MSHNLDSSTPKLINSTNKAYKDSNPVSKFKTWKAKHKGNLTTRNDNSDLDLPDYKENPSQVKNFKVEVIFTNEIIEENSRSGEEVEGTPEKFEQGVEFEE